HHRREGVGAPSLVMMLLSYCMWDAAAPLLVAAAFFTHDLRTHLKVSRLATSPTTSHTPSISATRPRSQSPEGSIAAKCSGKNTLRMPCASHFRGKIPAKFCNQVGSIVNCR